MRKLSVFCLVLFLFVGAFAFQPSRAEAYTAYNRADIEYLVVAYWPVDAGSIVVNNQTLSWAPSGQPDYTDIFVNGQFFGTVYDFDLNGSVELIAKALGIPLMSAGSINDPSASAATTSRIVFDDLVLPAMKTLKESKREELAKQQGKIRTIGGVMRAEVVENGDDDGQIYGFNLGLAYDYDTYTFGLIVAADEFNFDSYDGTRVGAIAFAQHNSDISNEVKMSLTANLNYSNANLDFDNSGSESIATVGGGLSAGLKYAADSYEVGVGASYQYNKDDVDIDDDEQHLLKLGIKAGYALNDSQVVNVFGVYSYDATDYEVDYGDDDSFELGAEYSADISDAWTANLGAKTIVDLDDYNSYLFYLGSAWQF